MYHYLQLRVPLIHKLFEVKSQVPGEVVQVIGRHLSTFQPLQVDHVLLVMSHLQSQDKKHQ